MFPGQPMWLREPFLWIKLRNVPFGGWRNTGGRPKLKNASKLLFGRWLPLIWNEIFKLISASFSNVFPHAEAAECESSSVLEKRDTVRGMQRKTHSSPGAVQIKTQRSSALWLIYHCHRSRPGTATKSQTMWLCFFFYSMCVFLFHMCTSVSFMSVWLTSWIAALPGNMFSALSGARCSWQKDATRRRENDCCRTNLRDAVA